MICRSVGTGLLSQARNTSLVGRLYERELLSVRIDERDRSLAATRLVARDVRSALREPVVPVVVASRRNRQRDLDAKAMPETPGRRMAEREEREVRSRDVRPRRHRRDGTCRGRPG